MVGPPGDLYINQLQKTIAEQRKRLIMFEKLFKTIKPSPDIIKIIQEQRKNKKQEYENGIKKGINVSFLNREYSRGFKNKTIYTTIPGINVKYKNNDEDEFIQKVIQSVTKEITDQLKIHKHIKVMISATAIFINLSAIVYEIYYRLKTFEVSYMNRINLNEKFNYIKEMLLEKEQGESGLLFHYIKEFQFDVVKNSKIRGSKYIPTPPSIK